MAYIVPADITQSNFDNAHPGELETLRKLRSDLSADYTIFHSVHWTMPRGNRSILGEIDFVIVNREGACLFIEQKNGALEEYDGGLFKVYQGEPKSVSSQIQRNIDGLRNKFGRQHPGQSFAVDYLFYCPDHRVRSVNASGLDSERIVDGSTANDLSNKIDAILRTGKEDKVRHKMVMDFFRQTLSLAPDVHAHVTQNEKAFTRLTGGLADAVDRIEMEPLRLRVRGCAGSGKTVVATRAFERAIQAGKRPLLVCFNRSLMNKMKAITSEGGLVQTWNGLCATFLEAKGHKIPYNQMEKNPRFWDEIQDQVLDEDVPDSWRFDTLIVDEGQDFQPEWYELLKLFLIDDYDALWLEDPEQNIRRADPTVLGGFVGYRDQRNFRSPSSIARFIEATLPFETECCNDLPGLGVGVSHYKNDDAMPGVVGSVVQNLIKGGFTPDQITILTMHGFNNSVLSERGRIKNHTLKRFTGEYDLLGNQDMSDGQILFDSIHRFKGQQAPAVILVDVDPEPEKADHWNRLLYAGMTRATVRLEIIANGDNSLNGSLFEKAG